MKKNNKFENYELISILGLSIILFIVIEIISRKSVLDFLDFVIESPLNAVVNIFVLLSIFGVTVFIKRKRFSYFIISFILISLSVVSSFLMSIRGMPLSPYDFMSYKEAANVANAFFDIKVEIMAIVLIALFLLICVWIFRKDKKSIWITGVRNIFIYVSVVLLSIIVIPQLKTNKIINVIAWDVGLSFKNNGFAYSFADETLSIIRTKPEGYSEEAIKAIRAEVERLAKESKKNESSSKVTPNIIMVQLESFMDPTRIEGITFDKDPMPNMRKLMKKYTSGFMNVPVIGGGTARTEYEVLSGSNFDFLQQGEIPYHTFLSEKPSLSIASNLNSIGYKTVAIHNFEKNFYNRAGGLEHLGFGKFIPLEVMTNVEYTPVGWPKDNGLTKYITQEIENKDGKPSFIFTVSTEGHGRYPTKDMQNSNYDISIAKSTLPKSDQNQILFYANLVYNMDKFVGDLVKEINKLKKPTVLVLYGDHLPALNVITEKKSNIDKFASIFTIVNNFGVPKKSVPSDFQAYQLSTLTLDTAGQNLGPMNLIHKYLKNDKEYMKKLEMVQYDILFGKQYFLKSDELPKNTVMKIGNDEMKLENVENVGGEFYLKGSGFNRQVTVFLDGKKVDSDYENETTIKLYDNFYTGEKEIMLRLIDKEGSVIQESNKFKYNF